MAKKGKNPKKERKPKPKGKPERKPRQARLPSMDDSKIDALHAAAEEYASIRDRRMALTKEEVRLQDEMKRALKEAGKEKYHHGGVTCTLITVKEKVKVRVQKESESE